ncbi:MAG: EamA family transporter [Candidatus Limnocylindrales bacterium]
MGVILALVGAASFALMNVSVRKGVRPGEEDNGVLTTVIVSVLIYSPLILIVAATAGITAWSWIGIGVFVVAGLASTFIGRTLLFGGIRRIGAARAAAIKNATPLVTLAIALTVLGEQLVPLTGLGIVLVMSGVFLIIRESMQRSAHGNLATDPENIVDVALEAEALAEGAPPRSVGLAGRTWSYVTGDIGGQALVGITLSLVAALTFGAAHALRKVGMDILPDALLGAATGSWAALIGYLVAATARGQLGSVRRSVTARRPYFWLAGLAGAMGQLSFFAALNFAPVSQVSVVASAEIVLTVLFAAIATHTEHITRRLVLPATLVFGGAAIIALAH